MSTGIYMYTCMLVYMYMSTGTCTCIYTCMAYTYTIVGRRATESSVGGPSRLCAVNVQIAVLREDITYRVL